MIVLSLIFLFFLILILIFCRKQISKKTKAILLITYIPSFFINFLLLKIKFFYFLLFLILLTFIIIWHEIKKKTKKDILITSSIILIFIVLLYTFSPRLIYYKFLYLDDRVKITTSVYVDGQKIEIDNDSLTIKGEGIGTISSYNSKNGYYISFAGSEYSNYDINMKANDYVFEITIAHWNWWDIFKIDLIINIDTEEGTITYTSKNYFIDENSDYIEQISEKNETKPIEKKNKYWIS